ncbi:MAG: chorismate-binding protein [Myxococcales bacterium]|nr:chorismate-binding protein [Myxococcales bacterium]
MSAYHPDPESFLELSRDHTVVPVHRELVADWITPVVAAATVGEGAGSFLLESVVGGEKWARYSFVGFDPAVILRGRLDRFERVRDEGVELERGVDPWERLREELAAWRPPPAPWLPRFWGGAVGYVGYDAVHRFEPKVGPLSSGEGSYEFSLAVGGTLLIFDTVQQTLRVVVPARVDGPGGPELAYAQAIERIEAAIRRLERPRLPPPLPTPDRDQRPPAPPSSFDRESYVAAVERIKEHIRAGDIFQAVLSQRFEIPSKGIDPFDIYRAMRIMNPSPYMYFLRLPEVRIAGASPETLVRLEDGQAALRPLAGTRPRGQDEAEDRAIERELLADPKERAEHVMLVDLGRNDLGRISRPGSVEVTDRMVVEKYSHVMHIVSNVIGSLAPGCDALDVLRATFPAGTLSGAPKVRAMQILDALEPVPRGIYGGAIGYLSFDGNLDMAIAIRTVVEREGVLRLQAGAGIVEASDPNAEYEETLSKARAALIAVRTAEVGTSGRPIAYAR